MASLVSQLDERCPGVLQCTVVSVKKHPLNIAPALAPQHMHDRGGSLCPAGSKPGEELRFSLAVLSRQAGFVLTRFLPANKRLSPALYREVLSKAYAPSPCWDSGGQEEDIAKAFLYPQGTRQLFSNFSKGQSILEALLKQKLLGQNTRVSGLGALGQGQGIFIS